MSLVPTMQRTTDDASEKKAEDNEWLVESLRQIWLAHHQGPGRLETRFGLDLRADEDPWDRTTSMVYKHCTKKFNPILEQSSEALQNHITAFRHGKCAEWPDLAIKPYEFQVRGACMMLHAVQDSRKLRGVVLADPMGFGKTLQCIMVMLSLRRAGSAHGPVLVVTRSMLQRQWQNEIRQAVKSETALKTIIVDSASSMTALQLLDYDVIITNYDTVRVHWKRRTEGSAKSFALFSEIWPQMKRPFRLLVLDEAHAIKNTKTQAFLAVYRLLYVAVILASGTVAENSWLDFYYAHLLVAPQLLGDLGCFSPTDPDPKEWMKLFGISFSGLSGNGRFFPEPSEMCKLQQQLSAFTVSRPYEELYDECSTREHAQKRSPLEYEMEWFGFRLSQEEKDATMQAISSTSMLMSIIKGITASSHHGLAQYHTTELEKDIVKCLDEQECSPLRKTAANIRKAREEDDEIVSLLDPKASSRLRSCMDRIQNFHHSDKFRKIVVFSTQLRMLKLLARLLDGEKIQHYVLCGDTTRSDRETQLQAFKDKPEILVYCVQADVGREGLNLQCASAVILLEVWWNVARVCQAIGRSARMGQEQMVSVVQLYAVDSWAECATCEISGNKARDVEEIFAKVRHRGRDKPPIITPDQQNSTRFVAAAYSTPRITKDDSPEFAMLYDGVMTDTQWQTWQKAVLAGRERRKLQPPQDLDPIKTIFQETKVPETVGHLQRMHIDIMKKTVLDWNKTKEQKKFDDCP